MDTPTNTPSSSWAKPSENLNSRKPDDPNSTVTRDNYRQIKTRYFQSLNLGKARQTAGPTNPPAKPLSKKIPPTSSPIPTHVRKRSNTQPAQNGDRKTSPAAVIPPAATSNQADYFVPFAMSIPANVVLGQSFAPSYLPRSHLDSRENLLDLDEDLVGPREEWEDEDMFEHSAPIEIPLVEEHHVPTMSVATPNFVDRDTNDFEIDQRRRAAKIRSMIPIE